MYVCMYVCMYVHDEAYGIPVTFHEIFLPLYVKGKGKAVPLLN
jgi:hypothetical protein